MAVSVEMCLSLLSDHWLAILVLTCISIFLYYWGIAPYRRSAIVAAVGDLPGPTPLPFVGNFLDMFKFKGQMHLQFDDYYKKYGRLFTIFFLSRKPTIVMSDPEMLKELFVKEFHNFPERPMSAKLPKPFDSMLTSAKGATWHRIRTILSPTFSGHKMKVMVPLLNKSCDILEKKLGSATVTGETIDVFKFFQTLSLESILKAFFGIESNAQLDDNDVAAVAASKATGRHVWKRMLTAIILRMPGGYYLGKLFPSFVMGPFMDLMALATKIVETKRNQKDDRTKDFLDMMLTNCESDVLAGDKRLTEDEVLAQSFVFLLAGYETTSNALALASYHLATNPEIQEKVQREIDDVWVDENQSPAYDMIQSLTYLEMVISESLRLYPPAVATVRMAMKDSVIKGLPIKKDTPIIALAYSIHRDPEFYPDPLKFDPERFSAEAKQSRDPYTYLPFGQGPRNCIGMRFALFEMKMILARILKKFDLVVAPETKIPPEVKISSLLGCGKDGMQLRVKRRE